MKSSTRRVVLGTVVALAAGVAALAATTPSATPADPWAALRLTDALEVEHYSDALAMRDAADLVAVGTFTGFTAGRSVIVPDALGPGEDDRLFWVNGTLLIEEIISGTGYSAGQHLTVEFFVGGVEEAPYLNEDVARLQAGLGDTIGRAVVFLRQEGGATAPGPLDPCQTWPAEDLAAYGMTPETCDAQAIYASLGLGTAGKPAVNNAGLRLVWSYGLVASTKDAPVDVPLGEKPEEDHEAPQIAASVQSWASLDEFIAYLRG